MRCPRCKHEFEPKRSRPSGRLKTRKDALFLARQPVPLSWKHRSDDPITSRLAAEYGRAFRPALRARLLAALIRHGPKTAREACALIEKDYDRSGAWRRFSELKRMDLAAPTGEIRDGQEVCRATIDPQMDLLEAT